MFRLCTSSCLFVEDSFGNTQECMNATFHGKHFRRIVSRFDFLVGSHVLRLGKRLASVATYNMACARAWMTSQSKSLNKIA